MTFVAAYLLWVALCVIAHLYVREMAKHTQSTTNSKRVNS